MVRTVGRFAPAPGARRQHGLPEDGNSQRRMSEALVQIAHLFRCVVEFFHAHVGVNVLLGDEERRQLIPDLMVALRRSPSSLETLTFLVTHLITLGFFREPPPAHVELDARVDEADATLVENFRRVVRDVIPELGLADRR